MLRSSFIKQQDEEEIIENYHHPNKKINFMLHKNV